MNIEEFACIWFEQSQRWIVLLSNGTVIDNNFGAIGYAANAAYLNLQLGEADFECTEDAGTFYRFEKIK